MLIQKSQTLHKGRCLAFFVFKKTRKYLFFFFFFGVYLLLYKKIYIYMFY